MENQKSSFHPLLSSTSRQFYSRRKLGPNLSQTGQVEKVLRLLQCSSERPVHRKIKTETKEEAYSQLEQLGQMRQLARVKVENSLKKVAKEWRGLLEHFDNYVRSSSPETLRMNEINFLLSLNDLLRRQSAPAEEKNRGTQSTVQKYSTTFLDNVKLAKENELLRDKIAALEEALQTRPLPAQPEERTIGEPEVEAFPFTAEGYNALLSEVEALRPANDLLREEKKSLQLRIGELKSSNENLCEQVVKCRFFSSENKQKVEMWRNVMCMQQEEITSLRRDLGDLRNELSCLARKYHNVLKRVSTMGPLEQGKLNELTKKSLEVFSEQAEFFLRMRSSASKGASYQPAEKDPREKKRERRQSSLNQLFYHKFLNEKDAISNSEGVKRISKDSLRFYKPTFFVYLEKYFEGQGIDRDNVSQLDLAVSVRFLVTLRAILDAKYNEYLLYRTTSLTPLPAFAVSWLTNFRIDDKSRRPQETTSDINYEAIGSFYIKLMNPVLNGSWEVIAFREFLLQSLTIDELVFYLHARFRLMRGDAAAGRGGFLDIYYVSYLEALLLIQEVVVDFNYRRKLEQYLKRGCESHRKGQMIDGHFILRLLLEYYRSRKEETFGQLFKIFSNYIREHNTHMPFENYLKLFDYNTFELSLSQKVQLYDRAFNLGRGTVALENVFAAMTEEGFLCPMVDRMFEPHPLVRDNGSCQAVQLIKQVEAIEQQLTSGFDRTLAAEIPPLGLQAVKRSAGELGRGRPLSFESLFSKIELLFSLSVFNLRKLFFSRRLKEEELVGVIPSYLCFLKQLAKSSIDKKNAQELMEDFRKKNAAKQIFNFYRRKKMVLVRTSLACGNETSARGQQKTESVRKEFVSIIENLRQKYQRDSSALSQVSSEDA